MSMNTSYKRLRGDVLEEQHRTVRASTRPSCCVVVKITNNHVSQSVARLEWKEGCVQEHSRLLFFFSFFCNQREAAGLLKASQSFKTKKENLLFF